MQREGNDDGYIWALVRGTYVPGNIRTWLLRYESEAIYSLTCVGIAGKLTKMATPSVKLHCHCTKSLDVGITIRCRLFPARWVTYIIPLYFLCCVVSGHKEIIYSIEVRHLDTVYVYTRDFHYVNTPFQNISPKLITSISTLYFPMCKLYCNLHPYHIIPG